MPRRSATWPKRPRRRDASVLMTNHSEFDDAYTKSRLVKVRGPGEPHPYEVGQDGVRRYFTLMEECALVAKVKLAALV